MINTSINAPSPKGQKEEMKQSLLQNDSTKSVAPVEKKTEEKKKEEKKKDYSLLDFMKFTLPYLWRGGFIIRVQTVLTFVLLLVSRGLNVSHPLILKFAIDDITCTSEHQGGGGGDCPHSADYTYILVGLYAVVRFLADFVNNIREIPFANVSASAEIYIAHLVYSHTQNQSLAYHLSRETGKVVRIVSRGSQSFAQILRIALFNILPLIIELILVLAIIFTLYPVVFFLVTCGSVVLYVWATVVLTEWRAKYFKSLASKDAEYS